MINGRRPGRQSRPRLFRKAAVGTWNLAPKAVRPLSLLGVVVKNSPKGLRLLAQERPSQGATPTPSATLSGRTL